MTVSLVEPAQTWILIQGPFTVKLLLIVFEENSASILESRGTYSCSVSAEDEQQLMTQ